MAEINILRVLLAVLLGLAVLAYFALQYYGEALIFHHIYQPWNRFASKISGFNLKIEQNIICIPRHFNVNKVLIF